MTSINVERITSLPADLESELLPAAEAEGFAPLSWLVEEWQAEKNRFDRQGEALHVARVGRRLLGVCGLNRDPYAGDDSTGRLRRLYIHPDHRRQGIGRRLVRQALHEAREHFDVVRLRTLDPRSAAFFETIGFNKLEGDPAATHRLFFDDRDQSMADIGARPSTTVRCSQ